MTLVIQWTSRYLSVEVRVSNSDSECDSVIGVMYRTTGLYGVLKGRAGQSAFY